MGTLRIILTILIFCSVGGVIYWKRHWIDKKLQKTWAILLLLVFAIVAFLVISIFFEFLFNKRPMTWENMLRIYGVFSQTSSAYSPPDASAIDYVYNLLLSIIGAFLFAGLLISAFNNMLTQRIEKVKEGLVNYNFSGHIVIIGANDGLLTIIRTITKRADLVDSKILIVTSKSIEELSAIRNIVGSKIWNRVYYIKSDILNLNEDNSDTVEHYLRRARVQQCRELYLLSDSKSSECDIDNARIISTIYKYIERHNIDNKRGYIDCYILYSNLDMTIKVCRDLEKKNIAGIPVFKVVRMIPFDLNMIFASKAFNGNLPESIDIVGLSEMSIALIKYLLLACHSVDEKQTEVRAYHTKQEREIKNWFELSYDFNSVKDIDLQFIEIEDSTKYVGISNKSNLIVLCFNELETNIKLAYALQRNVNHQELLVYSTSTSLDGVFTDNRGNRTQNMSAFGDLNQSIDGELSKIKDYTIKSYRVFCDLLYRNLNPTDDKDKYKYCFDHLKWRLLSMGVLSHHQRISKEMIMREQIAATIIGGYKISNTTDFNSYNISESNLTDFYPVFKKVFNNDNEYA